MAIPINLVVEDSLSERTLVRIINSVPRDYIIGHTYAGGGSGYIRKNIRGFNHAAKGVPYLVLTDLDRYECAPALVEDWLNIPKDQNLIFRVAVREVETWLLADRHGFANYIGVPVSRIRYSVEEIENPKEFLIGLVRRSRKRRLKKDIVPPQNSTAKIGRNYNGRLIEFVENFWNMEEAASNSNSLRNTISILERFEPH